MSNISLQIATLRKQSGMTQKQLAELLGTKQSAVARLENPNYNGHSLNTLRRVAEIFGAELTVTVQERGE